ncbi:hypothetical protein PFICI_13556 [Pestalotiopsis fici W106-1]|uniref:Nephrocystin 3-like N-terminal domain-containing protein n=1 Tax=Pestalotiopsis fici (strain W106-1 / CGMCC3.15140) TaxID=1229662 RepID=W3WPI7_PESFW|nr:uncharacterized protein PFICI_13556 [Pestalotiopsis fici W106-1]ETS75072.1 hypothetical protein PFICI_13556 [Pestalotiopsis fici W106-1]
MEALGAAASIAGLVSLAIEIPKLIDTINSIKSAPGEALQLSSTVDALIATLQKLESFLKTDEAREMHLADDYTHIEYLFILSEHNVKGQRYFDKVSMASRQVRMSQHCGTITCNAKYIRVLLGHEKLVGSVLSLDCVQQMAKSHKEVISHFKTQSEALAQMAAAFPDQAIQASNLLKKIESISSCVESNARQLDAVHLGVNNLQEMNKDFADYCDYKIHGQALEWLSPLDPFLRHEEIQTSRLPGTCKWISEDSDFISWAQTLHPDKSDDVCCRIGDPGQGKTYTMSYMIEHLEGLYPSGTGVYVTYLYCDYQRTKDFPVQALIGAIVRLLLSQFDRLPHKIRDLVTDATVKLRRPNATIDQMHQILSWLEPQVERIFICIDALDEYENAEELVNACRRLPLRKSLLFVGRHSIFQSLRRSYPQSSCRSINPPSDDIEAVIAEGLAKAAARDPSLMPETLKVEIQKGISKLANGMFLLATLHLALVLSRNTILQRRLALSDLPPTLDGTFSQTLKRIKEHTHASQALRILAWIHCIGPSPLELIRQALAVEPSHSRFEEENLPSRLSMLDCCFGLARIDTIDTIEGLYHGKDKKVALVHSTLSTYFQSNKSILNDAMVMNAESCLALLSFPLPLPGDLLGLARDWWVSLLCDLNPLPTRLSKRACATCVQINIQINDGNLQNVPRHARMLLAQNARSNGFHRSQIDQRQPLLNTICMLGLDVLDLDIHELLEADNHKDSDLIDPIDMFGSSPLGWALLPANHFRTNWQFPQPESSFKQCLLRAGKLIGRCSIMQPRRMVLWSAATLAKINEGGHTHLEGGTGLRYPNASPLLFFIANHSCDTTATEGCLEAIKRNWDIDVWSMLQGGPGATSVCDRCLSLQETTNLWNLVVWGSEESEVKSSDTYDTCWPGGNWDKYQPKPTPRWDMDIIALFEPGKYTPVHSFTSQERWHKRRALELYCSARKDISLETVYSFPAEDYTIYKISLPQQAILQSSAISAFYSVFVFALLVLKLDPIVPDPQGMFVLQICAWDNQTVYAKAILDIAATAINLQDQHGRTALHYAVEIRSRKMVSVLLRRKADPNIADLKHQTPLHLAIIGRDLTIFEMLISSETVPKLTSSNMGRAWNLALEAGGSFAMRLLRIVHNNKSLWLLDQGDTTAPSALAPSNGILQLMIVADQSLACTDKDLDFMIRMVTKSLVKSRPPATGSTIITARSNQFSSPSELSTIIRSAIVNGADAVAAYILHNYPIDIGNISDKGESALHLAVIYNAPKVFQFLLDCDSLNSTAQVNFEGYTVLHLTLVHKRLDILQILLHSNKVNAGQVHSSSGATALHLAIRHSFTDAVPLLLSCPQIDFDVLDEYGRAALHHAVLKQDVALVKLLLDCPMVTPTVISGDGRTALAYAALCAGEEMITVLLEVGSFDLSLKDTYGKTALDWARLNTSTGVAAMLEAAGSGSISAA